MQRLPTVRTLTLGPLSREETAEQLEILAAGTVGPDQVDRIHHRSAGQPLFTEQLAAQGDDDQPLPQLLGDLLDRRIEGLDPQAWTIARALGVADRALTDTLLTEVTGLETAELAQGLHELDQHRLLRDSTGHDVELRHPLLAEAVRRRLVAPEAVDEHRRIATALALVPDASPAEVAEHWQRAEDPGQEIRWRIRAAQAAGQRFALAQEAEQWRRALDLWPDGVESLGSPAVRKEDAYLAAMDAMGHLDVAAAWDVAQEAMSALSDPTTMDAAETYQRAAGSLGHLGDQEGALRLLERAIRIYESAPPSAGYVQALGSYEYVLDSLGREREGAAVIALAIEVSAGLGDTADYRTLLSVQAWSDARNGDLELALSRIQQAVDIELSEPDPRDEIYVAVNHTLILLLTAAGPDEVAAAARPGLEVAARWGLDTWPLSALRSNIAQAMRLAGQVRRAAELIDPITEGAPSHLLAGDHAVRAHLDVLRGRLDAATERFEALCAVPTDGFGDLIEFVEHVADADLWCGRPRACLDRAVATIRDTVTTSASAYVGGLFVLAARAAADLADARTMTATTRRELLGELEDLLARAATDPFAVHPTIAGRPALAATWAAESARLAGTPSVERWVAAAREWDRLTRPHDASYCRWRAGEVALTTGQGTTAVRLLRRAEHDAREHVPLLAAIRRTQAGATSPG